jgi:hypothetical protein
MRRLRLVSAMAVAVFTLAAPVAAQAPPDDVNVLPPVPADYTPDKTEWGDWDFTGTWPIENIPNTRILFQRPVEYGMAFWLTPEQHDKRVANAERSDSNFAAASEQGIGTAGTEGLVEWTRNSNMSWRTSMLVSPADGQLPPLTPEGQRLYEAGRSGWVPGQHFDWVSDFDSWDRCVSRGYPASMYPFRYNNGIRVHQAPGVMVIELEMLGTRVVPIYPTAAAARAAHWPEPVEAWMGDSRGWWEGKTFVIETTNIVSGDSATYDVSKRSASPVNMATQHVPPFNTIPMSTQAKTLERLTMTDANTIVHELTYSDPEVYTQPWATRLEWSRNQGYEFFEYACHEGNYAIRDYINASRAHRKGIREGTMTEESREEDSRTRFAGQFDFDPVVTPPRAPPAPPPAEEKEED